MITEIIPVKPIQPKPARSAGILKPVMIAFMTVAIASGSFSGAIAQSKNQDDKIIAKVNGEKITFRTLKLAQLGLGQQLQNVPQDERMKVTLNMLIDMILFAQKAKKEELDKNPTFVDRLRLEQSGLLRSLYIANIMEKAGDEKTIKAMYDAEKKNFKPEDEIRARHILVSTEKQAKEIYDKLKKGEDFAKMAKEKSKDPTNLSGGDLGYFTKEKMIPEFADAAAKLKVGQISNPVKTSVGWHIIKVEDKRKTKPLTYEEAKPILLDKIRRDAYRKELTTIRDSAKIEILDLPKPAADKSKKK